MTKKSKRRTLSPQFKFRVAMEALRERQSINETAAQHKVHPAQVTAWKKELLENGSAVFERKNAKNHELEEQEAHTAQLERTLGQILVEKEYLVKKCKQLGIDP